MYRMGERRRIEKVAKAYALAAERAQTQKTLDTAEQVRDETSAARGQLAQRIAALEARVTALERKP